MTLIVENTSSFNPAPAGLHEATLTTVTDLGEQDTSFGSKELLQLEFELGKKDPETNQPYRAWRRCTKSLASKSTLRGILESLLERDLQNDETKRFDVERLLGTECLVQVAHVEKDGRTYANIKAVLPVLKDEEESGETPF